MQGWFTGMIYVKLAKMCHEAGLPITGENLKNMLPKIKNWDTGGLNGVVNFVNSNATATGKVYKAKNGKFVPVSDWIRLDE
jgi:hypothetical protein